ncbi:MAG TPA: FAD-dependent oxidoreductase [Gemmatimonadaceae bacterium]|nr:FAD-dependent oxidoreductase [Gemmatimonadaceae bacterium]
MSSRPDAIVVGGGLIGLASALALAERGAGVIVIGERRVGEASPAAAGMLAPSVERASGPAHAFAIAARDRYPGYLERLMELTGIRVPLNRLGILQLALSEKGIRGLRRSALPTSRWLEQSDVRELEPALSHGLGAVYNADDGAVDNTVLFEALDRAVGSAAAIRKLDDAVLGVEPDDKSCVVHNRSGTRMEAPFVVLAAGAWSGSISGAPFARAVAPARGQLVSYSSSPLRHVVYGPRGYVVPRGDGTIGGSTMENTGFDAGVTESGIRNVRQAAEEICPSLRSPEAPRAWAGLRPVTPDMLPILGADPDHPSLIYACGHSRNGVLMAPLTGDVVADLVTGAPLSHDLSQFRPGRF